ncbi:hypothetical protein LY28_02829 [Ruminiclostridium sufflavum DSM 19573]|uniref:Uncharacterized protein n=1 Tax=Ruminiclostridium sufflavum DSM 19573 TaxID=1121337 RepID=A0A318XLE3_9FIRM|nr:DUF6550 family protein [Ruminiclostridium sufflavum]PYG86802.1 hypothetical protein LY28_02829 [Ruminiclostridium sufflavum DSM 19573]
MNNINDKTKKRLIIAGGLIVSIMLIIMIAAQFKKEPVKEVSVSSPSAALVSTDTVTVTPAEASKTQKDIVVQDSKVAETTKSKTQAPNTAISSGTKQTIQPDPVKPTAPTEKPKSTDKTSDEKPTVTGKPKTTVKDNTISKTEPKGGEKKDGEIYVPGFGWVKDNGGGSQGEVVGSDGDINKQVGTMD